MNLTLYQVDAFTKQLFGGNPAAVIPLDKWIDDRLMQQLAVENNLSETVFFVRDGDHFNIRWFTPGLEINLCGHATLASAYVLYDILGYDQPDIRFESKSGPLHISRKGEMILMDFPSWKPERITDYDPEVIESIGDHEIAGIYRNRDIVIELMSEKEVKNCSPDFTLMKKTGEKVIITAPAEKVDFVSRFFAPIAGIDEDPVTGSAHSQLIPFWSEKLGKTVMEAKQLSARGGTIYCEQKGDRVSMGGYCVFYMKGEIQF